MTTTSTQPTDENIRVQGLINQIGGRLSADAAFKTQYDTDPKAALVGAGLPESAVGQVTRLFAKADGSDEVSGYDDYGSTSSDSSGGYHYEYTPSTATSSPTSQY